MKKNGTRITAFLLTLVIVLGTICAVPTSAQSEAAPIKRTVMLYISGSNLESLWGRASWNLMQSMEANYDENLDFIVITGGAKEWITPEEYLDGVEEVDPVKNQIWRLEGKREGEKHGKMTLLEANGLPGFETEYLSKPGTLTAFIDYCTDNYPADKYDLILWDHGGGFAGGFGHDERWKFSSMMTMATIIGAFDETKLIKSGEKFEIIDFDACLMSSVEVVAALAPYADYMVMSPETEPGSGQDYTPWLNALCEDPSMNGFEIGKHIVDGLAEYYNRDENKNDATLAVIDTKNFTERLLGEVAALDDILINEARSAGEKNNKYNFYDELYSLLTAFKYVYGEESLYDLGNLVGGLSAPQSEMDNYSSAEIEAQTNVYTEVALRILSVLADDDGSEDDVIYSAESELAVQAVDGYYIRGLDGEFLEPGEDGFIRVDPTGLSVFFGDGNISNVYKFVNRIMEVLPLVKDEATREFLRDRAVAAVYYALIVRFGQIVSEISAGGTKYVSWRKVSEYIENSDDSWTSIAIPIMIDRLVTLGEFESTDEANDFFSMIVVQQAKEALKADKVKVRKIIEADGSSDYYQVTVNNSSAQSLMYVNSGKKISLKDYETPEFDMIYQDFYDAPIEETYPDGIYYTIPIEDGELDLNYYYEDIDDNLGDIYQRIYSSSSSVWIVPEISDECFILYDSEGTAHPAQIQYRDRSKKSAIVPIQVILPDDYYCDFFLSIALTDDGWQVIGITQSDDDLTERAYVPMDHHFFEGAKYTTEISITDNKGETSYIPISTFCDIDFSKDKWGISFAWENAENVPAIESMEQCFSITDVYGHKIDMSELFKAADAAAEAGDVAYEIGAARIEVGDAFYNGSDQKPDVTVTLNEKTLKQGVDFKLLYDGSVLPGEAYVAVLGIGNYVGTAYAFYTIECGEHALTHFAANDATKYANGNIEYWFCDVCGKFFSDENCENEIAESDTVVEYVPVAGDVNGDGKLNARDVIMLMDYIVGFDAEGFDVELADVDSNGKLNARDVILMMRFIASQAG